MTVTELEWCIDSYGKEIYSFCRQITGSVWEGEDLYQDTFLKAVELSGKMDLNHNPKSYLLSIAIRLWKNKRRKYAWRQRLVGMESLEEKEEGGAHISNADAVMPEEDLIEKEQEELVRKCIAALPESYRIPVYLYYSAELSVKEIAGCLKLPEGTVKSRLHKARSMIKEGLEVAGYDR